MRPGSNNGDNNHHRIKHRRPPDETEKKHKRPGLNKDKNHTTTGSSLGVEYQLLLYIEAPLIPIEVERLACCLTRFRKAVSPELRCNKSVSVIMMCFEGFSTVYERMGPLGLRKSVCLRSLQYRVGRLVGQRMAHVDRGG